MRSPADLRYAKTHEWSRREADGTVSVGITHHAQEALGDLVFVELPVVGRKLKAGEQCGVVESVKAASDIYAPVSGEVVEINAGLADAPQRVNEDAWLAWFYRLRPDNATDLDGLLDAPAYDALAAAGDD